METCHLSDFMKSVEPWLSDDYIREAYLDDKGRCVLLFTDGVKNIYHIDDCTASQLTAVLDDLKRKGVRVRT